jgi:hypothetical protein
MRPDGLMLRCAVLMLVSAPVLSGCVVVTVAGAAVSVATTAVKVTAKTAVKVVEVAIPDGDSDDKDKKAEKQ